MGMEKSKESWLNSTEIGDYLGMRAYGNYHLDRGLRTNQGG